MTQEEKKKRCEECILRKNSRVYEWTDYNDCPYDCVVKREKDDERVGSN